MEAEIILGIESSCDDTAIAIVTREGKVLASSIAGQEDVHRNFGGVYPEFASRAHVQSILPAIQDTLAKSGLNPEVICAALISRKNVWNTLPLCCWFQAAILCWLICQTRQT